LRKPWRAFRRRLLATVEKIKARQILYRSGAPCATCDKPVDKEYDYCADHATNEARAFSGLIPTDSLPKVGGDERADNSQNSRQNKALRLRLSPGMMNLAITPTINPTRIVQMMLINCSCRECGWSCHQPMADQLGLELDQVIIG
jgi:hypothetical protein